mmetsp:Transcript_10871/g.16438  ORF Transcript_10871/g.16438 Transcript_10871/m.16438 type:complete len:125 (-) Transcript_10871:624-998(-)
MVMETMMVMVTVMMNMSLNVRQCRALHARSAFLRQIAVNMLTPHHDINKSNNNDNAENNTNNNKPNNRKGVAGCSNSSSNTHSRNNSKNNNNNSRILRRKRKTPLFLQGNEYLYRDDLLYVAAS